MKHLAELNIARLKYDADDEKVAPFMNALNAVNGVADRSKGFVWRHTGDTGQAVDTRIEGDPRIIVNLSVWEGVAPLEHLNTHGNTDHAFGWSHLPAATI